MSRKAKLAARIDSGLVEVKSKFEAEFRRFAINRQPIPRFEEFYVLVEKLHALQSIPFSITYTDPEGDLLPINNNDNFAVALTNARPVLRLIIQQRGQSQLEVSGYGTAQRRRNKLSKYVPLSMNDVRSAPTAPHVAISLPEDFRRVSAIIDVDVVPATQRRVRLMKSGVDAAKPLGFYIRDGTSVRVTAQGVEKVPAIFISRLVPGGIAESTGLLAVNDEVLEVNGIEVAGKTLDQVTDMMVANSSNMIITVKPANQNNNIMRRGAPQAAAAAPIAFVPSLAPGGSPKSAHSYKSATSGGSTEALMENDEDEDEVQEHVGATAAAPVAAGDVVQVPKPAWSAQMPTPGRKTPVDELATINISHRSTGSGRKVKSDDLNVNAFEPSVPTSHGNAFGDGDARGSMNSASSRSSSVGHNASAAQDDQLHLSGNESNSSGDASRIVGKSGAEPWRNGSETKMPTSGNTRVIFTTTEDL